ncbi:MAG: FliH/SctL family protein [Gammaproteobacteria bacterium]|nr:FliH/SctL family protein [Gammaproteobacteria bacterium]
MSETIIWPDLKSRVPHINQALKRALAEAEEEGHRQGFERGQEAGRAAAEVELIELRARYGDAVRTLDATRLSVGADQIRSLADTVYGLCEKIIGTELTTSPDVLDKVLAHAVEKLGAEPLSMEIRVNPEDHQWLGRHDLEVRVVSDISVVEGTVVVQTLERSEEYKPLQVLEKAFEAIRDDLDDG